MFVYDGFGADNRRYTLQTMRRVFGYAASLDTAESRPKEGYAYTKYSIRTNRRNAVLLTVPSMFAITNASKREVFGETFNRMSVDSEGRITAQRILENSTTPRKSLPQSDYELSCKLIRYALGRGYDMEEIRNCLGELYREEEDAEEDFQ